MMRSQPNCFEVDDVIVFVVLYVDIVVQGTSKVDLGLLVMEVEFGWGGVVVRCGGVETYFRVKPNLVELSRGCVEVELGL